MGSSRYRRQSRRKPKCRVTGNIRILRADWAGVLSLIVVSLVSRKMVEQEFSGATFDRVCRRIRTNVENENDPYKLGDGASSQPPR